ncbi:MAG: conserved exported protein of unknown function [Candidatus Thorarchaeota archaeon]|nr:MAG: conserved exported protein of unknown function [Candidatus Thorarchaeota archaeon]
MSNYQQNKTMVICIIAVIAIGSITAGALAFFGSTNFGWGPFSQYGFNWNLNDMTLYQFEDDTSTIAESTTLRVNLSAGIVNIKFVESSDLLYRFDMLVPNNTIEQYGAPEIGYTANTISLEYAAAAVNITLGSASNYTMDIDLEAGAVDLTIGQYSHIGDIDADVGAGSSILTITDESSIVGDVEINLSVEAGSVEITVDLPSNVGGDFEASTSFGGPDVTTSTWTRITDNHYQTSDYDTAVNTVSILASAGAGSVTATLI